jgi:hypothetical protein
MDNFDRIKRKIKSIISGSKIPEDPEHAQNTLEWLLRLKPNADQALQISAFGHDIERAIDRRKVKRQDYPDYDSFKDAHAQNNALILREIMQDYYIQQELIGEVFRIVTRHEIGGDARSELIRDADGVSFFEINLPLFFEREGWKKTMRRCLWGYGRLSRETKHKVQAFVYDNVEINSLIKCVIKER